MKFKDYYKIMGLAHDATQDEVKRTYRQLARKYHPDVSNDPEAEARFKELGEANTVLKDIVKRAAYDRLGANWQAGQDFRPPPDWNAGFESSGNGANGKGADDFSRFFGCLSGRGSAGGGWAQAAIHSRGEDRRAQVMIDRAEVYSRATRDITLDAPTPNFTVNRKIPPNSKSGCKRRLKGKDLPGITPVSLAHQAFHTGMAEQFKTVKPWVGVGA